jgi:hypothetical protein
MMSLRQSLQTGLSLLFGVATMTLFPALLPAGTSATQASPGIVAWVSIEPASEAGSSQMLSIIGHAHALKPVQGRYTLEIKRKSKGGISNTRQGGAIDLKPGETTTLSRSGINVAPADLLDIELKIHVDGREVFAVTMKSVVDGEVTL